MGRTALFYLHPWNVKSNTLGGMWRIQVIKYYFIE
jgi:hypothetical protein